MVHKKHFLFISSLAILLLFQGCKKGDNPADSPLPNESEVLAKYLEDNGDFINTNAPAMISASEIREGQLNKRKQIVLDLRSNCDYHTLGHIEGAIHIQMKDIPWYYRNNDLASMEKVIITCNTGQHASYAAALLRYNGYSNVYAMMWGMSSWNSRQNVWTSNLSDDLASEYVTIPFEKNPAGNMPALNTGKIKPDEILAVRVKESLDAGFKEVEIQCSDVFQNLSDYYVINYAAYESYIAGHFPNSVQYTPNQDLRLATYLRTIPADKNIAVYCFTGQTSAHVAAYLKILGYNVKTILFGNNGMNYSTMAGKKFTSADVNDFPYVH